MTNSGNNYSGGTTIGSGATLSINSDAELGQVPSSPTTNIAINGGTLRTTGSFTLNTNRGISLGPTNGGGTINVAPGTTLNYGGFISDASGSNSLTITDSGTLVLSGTNAYGGGTTVQGGATLSIDPSHGSVGSGTVTVNGGTLSLSKSNPLNNSLNVLGSSVIDVTGTSSATVSGAVTLLGSTLQITGGSTGTNAPYSVALGTQGGSFSFGDGPSTIQLNSNGTGAASLTLGALTGGNGLPLITFSGTGTTTLGSASSMLPVDTQITVGPGGMVLNSNNSTAMGIFSLVTINSGSTLNLGRAKP